MSTQRKKILFLLPSLAGGGAQRVFITLLRHLDRAQFEPHLGLLQGTGPYATDVPTDVVVHIMKISRVRFALPSVIRLVWRVKPDRLVSTLSHLNLMLALAKKLLPPRTKLLIRESMTASRYLWEETTSPRVWAWLYRRFYRSADAVICLSDSMVDDLADQFGLPREKLVRIYNPIDIDRVIQMAELDPTPYEGNGPRLIAAGRLSREKGFDLLLKAMVNVVASFPDIQLTILGDGPCLADLKTQASRLNLNRVVKFAGFRLNPWPFLKHADLFVLPSRCEGLPNVVLEALALDVPVVATDCCGGVREISQCDSRVLVVPREDVDALVSAIVSICQRVKDRRKYRVRREELARRFGLEKIVEEYSALLHEGPQALLAKRNWTATQAKCI